MPSSGEPGRSTVSRVFAVLGAFDGGPPAMTLSEVAATAGLPLTTTFRLVKELLAVGALERSPEGDLQVGLRLWELGSLAPRQFQLRRIARQHMETLHETTSQTVQLVVAEDHRALCVEKISGRRSATNVTEIARHLPLHATGVGKVVLAFSSTDSLEGLQDGPLPRYTPRTTTVWTDLQREVLAVRRDHVGFCREELTLGTASVAAPVLGVDGEFVGALGILTASPHGLTRHVDAVRETALQISRRLGYDGAGFSSAARRRQGAEQPT